MLRLFTSFAILTVGALLCGSALANAEDAGSENDVVLWNKTLLTIVRTPGAQPANLHPTRSFAMMHAAIYDAVNSIDGRHHPYLVRIERVSREASKAAAAQAAAHAVLVSLYPSFQTTLDTQLQEELAEIPDGPNKSAGVSVGEVVAQAILTLRAHDGSGAPPVKIDLPNNPGVYQSTPPNFPAPAFTQWSGVAPFGIRSARQFRPEPPPALNSGRYTKVFDEVKSLGTAASTTTASEVQQLIGTFWNGAIQNYWNEIAQTTAQAHHLPISETARLFALLNIALADSVIAFYDAKYTYLLWRPVTAIRAADTDGNPNTAADPLWLPRAGKTAPDPSYPGAHATISAAAEEVLTSFFGRERFHLVVTSEVLPGVVRTFDGFAGAEQEASVSRVYAGQHFQSDEDAGEALGREVAHFDVEHLLRGLDWEDRAEE